MVGEWAIRLKNTERNTKVLIVANKRHIFLPLILLSIFLLSGLTTQLAGIEDHKSSKASDGSSPSNIKDTSQGSVGAEESVGEELLLFEDIPVVVSAARQKQPINQLSVPVSVLTKEDIHYSGLTTIPDLLQYIPGMDVLQSNRNNAAVGVRGLHDTFSDRTLVLIDGQAVNNPGFGATEWQRLPVLVEDIERIEVVRGPGGAVWGANAFNGVINIITKDTKDTTGLFLSDVLNHVGDNYTHLRWGHKAGRWQWRQSVGYRHQKSSEDFLSDDNFFSRDFSRKWTFDGQAKYSSSEQTDLILGWSYTNVACGDFELSGYFPGKDIRHHSTRLFSRIEHTFESGSNGHLQWFGNYLSSHMPNLMDLNTALENDLEGQFNTKLGDHKISFGGNVRLLHFEAYSKLPEEFIISGDPVKEQWVGLFGMDRWAILERLTLEGQIRGDWYSGTGADWSGRCSALYALDQRRDHILRISGAKSFRAPTMGYRRVYVTRMQIAPGLYAINFVKPWEDLKNEQIWSLEAGYTGQLGRGFTVRLDSYLQRMEDLIGGQQLADPLSLGRRFLVLDNLAGVDAYGAETEIAWTGKRGKLSAWYAFNDAHRDNSEQSIRSFLPAKHKVGLTGRLFFLDGWTLNANYRYTTTTNVDSMAISNTGASHRLDLALAKTFAEEKGEMSLGISDIFNKDRDSVYSSTQTISHETPGRTFFGRVQLHF